MVSKAERLVQGGWAPVPSKDMTVGELLPPPCTVRHSGHENELGMLEGLPAVCQSWAKNHHRASGTEGGLKGRLQANAGYLRVVVVVCATRCLFYVFLYCLLLK